MVVGGVVYFGSGDGKVYALDAARGAIYWRSSLTEGSVVSSPAVVGGVVYVGSGDGNVWRSARRHRQGPLVALIRNATASVTASVSTPVVVGGVVYVGSGDGKMTR